MKVGFQFLFVFCLKVKSTFYENCVALVVKISALVQRM